MTWILPVNGSKTLERKDVLTWIYKSSNKLLSKMKKSDHCLFCIDGIVFYGTIDTVSESHGYITLIRVFSIKEDPFDFAVNWKRFSRASDRYISHDYI